MEEGDRSLSQSRATHAPLLRAILEDDWKTAEAFIQENPNCLGVPITKDAGTALHNAASAKRTRFVKELVKRMTPEQLELKTNGNCTALYFAALSQIVTIAEVMVKKNNNLPSIYPEDCIQASPLCAAIRTGNRDMVSYLYSVTPIQDLASPDLVRLLEATISNDLYDTAHKILDTLKLAPGESEEYLRPSLEMLAQKPSKIGNKSQPFVWERCLNSVFRGQFYNIAMMQASAHQLVDRLWKQLGIAEETNFPTLVPQYWKLIVEAAKVGNVEFLIILVRTCPNLIWEVDEEYGTLFHIAVQHRQEQVFNLIYEMGGLKDILLTYHSKGLNNMLHLAGKLPSLDRLNIITGEALQMQQELWWFQKIKKIVPKSYVNQHNEDGETPRDIFVRTHEVLQKNGEKWMKEIANTCMLVATLIITVVFPAAFTVPGGNNQETGNPIFLESNCFTLFFVSDAVAMVFSSSSVLVFLSIFTSRYSEEDFFVSLPSMLALGIVMLTISIVGMLTAFTTACLLVFKLKTSALIGLIGGTCLIVFRPFSFYFRLYYELLFYILRSLYYFDGYRFRSQNRLFKHAS